MIRPSRPSQLIAGQRLTSRGTVRVVEAGKVATMLALRLFKARRLVFEATRTELPWAYVMLASKQWASKMTVTLVFMNEILSMRR